LDGYLVLVYIVKRKLLFALTMVSIVMVSACGHQTEAQLYRNDDIGISFEYPEEWQLRENSDNLIELVYEEDGDTQFTLSIEMQPVEPGGTADTAEMLETQMDLLRTSVGADNFVVIKEPTTMENGAKVGAFSIMKITLFPPFSNMSFDFEYGMMVVSQGGPVALIEAMSRGYDRELAVETQLNLLFDSLDLQNETQ
jgi:hypothetical protein